MVRRITILVGAIFVLAAVLAAWREMSPRFETATSSEILALVPPHLREAPPRDPHAEARFMAAYRVIREGGDPRYARLAALVKAGPWSVPSRFIGQNVEWPFDGLAEVFAERIVDAARRNDRQACADTAALALKVVLAYDYAGGEVLDLEVATNMLPPLAASLEAAASLKALSTSDRARLLALIPKDEGTGPVLAAIAANFRLSSLPQLLKTARRPSEIAHLLDDSITLDAGTYDPRDTTALFVRFAEIDQKACRLGVSALSQDEKELNWKVQQSLPKALSGNYPWNGFLYRWSLNHGKNTLGRLWAVEAGSIYRIADMAKVRRESWRRIRSALQSIRGQAPGADPTPPSLFTDGSIKPLPADPSPLPD